jgi:S1-C subfamily serine protease
MVGGAPAPAAGLATHDLLLAAGERPVETLDDLQRVLVLAPGGEIAVEVLRGGKRERLAIRPRAARAAA